MALALPFLWNHLVQMKLLGKTDWVLWSPMKSQMQPSTWCNAAPIWKAHFTGSINNVIQENWFLIEGMSNSKDTAAYTHAHFCVHVICLQPRKMMGQWQRVCYLERKANCAQVKVFLVCAYITLTFPEWKQ